MGAVVLDLAGLDPPPAKAARQTSPQSQPRLFSREANHLVAHIALGGWRNGDGNHDRNHTGNQGEEQAGTRELTSGKSTGLECE